MLNFAWHVCSFLVSESPSELLQPASRPIALSALKTAVEVKAREDLEEPMEVIVHDVMDNVVRD